MPETIQVPARVHQHRSLHLSLIPSIDREELGLLNERLVLPAIEGILFRLVLVLEALTCLVLVLAEVLKDAVFWSIFVLHGYIQQDSVRRMLVVHIRVHGLVWLTGCGFLSAKDHLPVGQRIDQPSRLSLQLWLLLA